MAQKRIRKVTREAEILRYMRFAKGVSLNQAGRLLRITGSAIAHMEQGRMDLSRLRIETMITAYGYSMAEYLEFLEGKEVPVSHRDACHRLIDQIGEDRAKVLLPMLKALVNN